VTDNFEIFSETVYVQLQIENIEFSCDKDANVDTTGTLELMFDSFQALYTKNMIQI
jgi:hypothetical protein